ncbi:YhcH/YjgK/YiaL family protein [Desulfovibrio gilichinskyi]|uniref:YhcH/YjgK/YiaL family protein n=1 Tax=Desulfovibrio gilichinskyi TaxID=1519643 RepID=A0A1X7CW74_9BACT|nr:YhcH/YjgK/YiaL family protein [Desulfovibrio gilichinskyi]SMF03942.1 YhcH/YjgK/YiaL family protein [Desulfovibrio gilichinskyi]
MIIDSLEQAYFYNFGPAWEKAFKFLSDIDLSLELGKHVIDGEDVFALVSEYETKVHAEGRFEAHRKYVDIQFLLSGREILGWAALKNLEPEVLYDQTRDVEFLKLLPEVPSLSTFKPGLFMAFFPEDGHMPGLAYANNPEPVKKVVVKITVAALCKP